MKGSGANVTVTTEVGYCPFCQRTRTLRSEVRHLGALVRTNVDCETCHRTLSSTIGPPPAAPAKEEAVPESVPEAPEAAPAEEKPARTRKAPATTAGTTRKPAAKSAAAKTKRSAPKK